MPDEDRSRAVPQLEAVPRYVHLVECGADRPGLAARLLAALGLDRVAERGGERAQVGVLVLAQQDGARPHRADRQEQAGQHDDHGLRPQQLAAEGRRAHASWPIE